MSLHRNFFARANFLNPRDPLSSPFAPSVLAVYASALSFLQVMRSEFEKHKDMVSQRWVIWIQALIAGVRLHTHALLHLMLSNFTSTILYFVLSAYLGNMRHRGYQATFTKRCIDVLA